jgi:hypothetical protein
MKTAQVPQSLTNEEDQTAQSEGWALFDAEGEVQLQKVDELGVFPKDEVAHAFVKELADKGSQLHCKVKSILKEHNPKEHDLVFG